MDKKVVLITGASRGIGRSIAKILSYENYQVIANFNKSEEKALELKKELQDAGFVIDIFKADVSKREDVHKMVEFTIQKYGKIDVLVNNAGISQVKLFTDTTDEDWDFILQNNLYSAFCCSQEVLKYMLMKKSRLHHQYFVNLWCKWRLVRGCLLGLQSGY